MADGPAPPAPTTADAPPRRAATEIVDRLAERARSSERLSVGDVTEALGSRGYGPFLFVPAIVELSPLGGIPGLPTLLALIIALFSAQIAAGRSCLWLPDWLERRTAPGPKLEDAMRRIRPVAVWLDRWFHGRFPALVSGPVVRAAAAVSILLCLTVPPLELIPFASSAPMGAIALFGLAMLARDGLLMALAAALAAAAIWLVLGIGADQAAAQALAPLTKP